MKEAIHPTYHPQAKVSCAGCGTVYVVGSTVATTNVELCSNCHPFYTGKQKLVDTAGRVDRFRARQAKADAKRAPAKSETDKQDGPADQPAPDSPESRLAEMKKHLEASDEANK